ncbi:hypothetical protein PLEOSDRAFT_1025604, partial [Pleurotus ostreatus PC15]
KPQEAKFPFASHPLPEDHWTRPEPSEGALGDPYSSILDDDTMRPHLLVSLSPHELTSWKKAYENDRYYLDKGMDDENASVSLTPSRFQRSDNGLVYFIDADWRYRLCVPNGKINEVLNLIHNSPHEGAHSGEK